MVGNKRISATHSVVCSMPNEFFGYFGWPTVVCRADGVLVTVASGLRESHICPFGRTTLLVSSDGGCTWESPRVINDTPLDDRDAGLTMLGGNRLLLSWFSSDIRCHEKILNERRATFSPERLALWRAGMARITDSRVARFGGSWTRLSEDGGETWGAPRSAPVNAPHGPARLADGSLLYLGREWCKDGAIKGGEIRAAASRDDGKSWELRGAVPLTNYERKDCHEAHVIQLPGGRLIGLIRYEYKCLTMLQSESDDGGVSWSEPHSLDFCGIPPHLFRHSSGVLILSYGYRVPPYGERIAFSRDNGASWEHDWILRDDAPDGDLGYPSTAELPDGSLVTVYYQKPAKAEDRCALLCSRWSLPQEGRAG